MISRKKRNLSLRKIDFRKIFLKYPSSLKSSVSEAIRKQILYMEEEIQEILNKKWKPLLENFNSIEHGNYPGIYLIAFTDKNIEGEAVKPSDGFYIGMSNARKGITSRVKQFINGIEKNGSHSGGMRFFKEFSKSMAFSKCEYLEKFYIVSLPFPCEVNKQTRTSKDLRIMGDICRLEYYLMAYIKEKTGAEPILNKK